jgi:hypothetical protein
MRDGFDLTNIQSVELCVNVIADGVHVNFLVPTDQTVQDALTQILDATVADLEPEDGEWVLYELSEKHASKESLRATLAAEEMSVVSILYEGEGWEINAYALADPSKLTYLHTTSVCFGMAGAENC